MEDHIRSSAAFHKRGPDTGLLPANLGETHSLWVCRKLLPWAEEFKCIWVMNNAASALILSRTVVLRRTLSCEAKLFIYHLMFQRSPAALSSGYWLKEWDQGHEWMTQDFWGGSSLRERSKRSDRPIEVVPASHQDVSWQTSPFGDSGHT